MTANSLIDFTIREIARDYQPGTFPWMKASRPDKWGEMVTYERRVNEMALGNDTEGLKRALTDYQRLILGMVREFKALKEERGRRMFKFK